MRVRLSQAITIAGRTIRSLDIDDAVSYAAVADSWDALVIYDAIARLRDNVQQDIARSARRVRGDRIPESLRSLVQLRQYLDGILSAIENLALEEEEEEEPPEDEAAEWEFGFEYETADFDDSHNVDVNFRVRRIDGRSFTRTEAERVMAETARNRGHIPQGYKIAAIDWRRPQRATGWKSSRNVGRVLGDFFAILKFMSHIPDAWRLGNPRR